MSFVPINWELVGNPFNWIIVTLMIVLVGLFLAVIFPQTAQEA